MASSIVCEATYTLSHANEPEKALDSLVVELRNDIGEL